MAPPRPTCREEIAAAPDGDVAVASRSLVFRAGGRVYACDVEAIREVVALDARARLARMPGAPASVVGLLNVRGKIVTVVDAGTLVHDTPSRAPARRGAQAAVLIVDCGVRGVGLAVERVADVRALRDDEGYQQLDVRALVRAAVAITEE